MKDKIEVTHYIRRGRPERAVIYVRGHDEEAETAQELKCKMYAKDKGYEVVDVTRYIEDVKSCDVLLVANFSRISRKKMTFVKTYKLFKARGIRVESAIGQHDIGKSFSAKDIYESLEIFFDQVFLFHEYK